MLAWAPVRVRSERPSGVGSASRGFGGFAIREGVESGRRADEVAEGRPAGVLNPMGAAILDADALERLERLRLVADGDEAPALEDHDRMLGPRVAVPVIKISPVVVPS